MYTHTHILWSHIKDKKRCLLVEGRATKFVSRFLNAKWHTLFVFFYQFLLWFIHSKSFHLTVLLFIQIACLYEHQLLLWCNLLLIRFKSMKRAIATSARNCPLVSGYLWNKNRCNLYWFFPCGKPIKKGKYHIKYSVRNSS